MKRDIETHLTTPKAGIWDRALKKKEALPHYVQHLVNIAVGLVILAIPASISAIWYSEPSDGALSVFGLKATGFSCLGLPISYYCVFLSIIWTSLWIMLLVCRVLPAILGKLLCI
jgi:hypothetical protein